MELAHTSANLSLQSLSPSFHKLSCSSINSPRNFVILGFQLNRSPILRLQAARPISNFPQGGGSFVGYHSSWSNRGGEVIGDYDNGHEDVDQDDEDEDRSLDLLIRFVENVFKKISRKARKAVRSVLPIAVSSHLVRFSVDGVIILAFLWVLKAFLQVVCTLGSVVFVSILLIRGIWTGIYYLQDSRNLRIDEHDDDHRTWNSTQPA